MASRIDYIEVWISNIGVMNSKCYDLQSLRLLIWAKIRKHSQIIWKLQLYMRKIAVYVCWMSFEKSSHWKENNNKLNSLEWLSNRIG